MVSKRLKGLLAIMLAWASLNPVIADSGSRVDHAERMKVFKLVLMVNHYALACLQAKAEFDVRSFKNWRINNSLDELEAYFREVSKTNSALLSAYESLIASMNKDIEKSLPEYCGDFHQLFMRQEYQPALAYPDTYAAILASHKNDSAKEFSQSRVAQDYSVGNIDLEATRLLMSRIERVVFDYKSRLGIGGYATYDVGAVLLFKNGEACTDMEVLVFDGGEKAHRKKYPKRWSQWKKSGEHYYLKDENEWDKIYFTSHAQFLPEGHKLSKHYKRLSGGGTMAVGGNSMFYAENSYQFFPSGQFVHGSMVASSMESMDVTTVMNNVPSDRKGTYSIDRYLLTLNYDNGKTEYRALAIDKKGDDVIWLDGDAYTLKD